LATNLFPAFRFCNI